MSPSLKRRIRVYAFTAGIVVAIMAGIPPLDEVGWPKVIIIFLGLIVGILNIRGEEQVERFLIAAIGLKVTSLAFLNFSGVEGIQRTVIVNLEIFITAGLLYVALVRIYEAFREKFNSYKVWVYVAAIVLVLAIWIFGKTATGLVTPALLGILLLGLIAGYFEGPKSPEEANAGVGNRFLVAAVAFQLSSTAVAGIVQEEFLQYEVLVENSKILLENTTIFTTSALLVIAFMAIFWVLDAIE